MIVAKLRGGLGNQLFQWATGYGLAQKLKVPLYLDLSVYSRNNARQFELANIGLPRASGHGDTRSRGAFG